VKFLTAVQVAQIHDDLMSTEPGLTCDYDMSKVEAVVGRVKNTYAYDDGFTRDVFNVAALYAETIAVGHAFPDGNKRTAFVASLTVLSINNIFPDSINKILNNLNESEEINYPTEMLVALVEKQITYKHVANVYMFICGLAVIGFGVVKLIDIIKKIMK
jgi:death-on-curing protein